MTCLPTDVWMLHRWYLDKAGQSFATPIFDEIVNIEPAALRPDQQSLGGVRLADGLKESKIAWFAREVGLESESIEIAPQLFEARLTKYGPLIYINKVPQDRLPTTVLLNTLIDGSHFSHAVLITGIESRAHGYQVYFDDPASGKALHLEFNEFVLHRYPPLGGLNKLLILYVTHNIEKPELRPLPVPPR